MIADTLSAFGVRWSCCKAKGANQKRLPEFWVVARWRSTTGSSDPKKLALQGCRQKKDAGEARSSTSTRTRKKVRAAVQKHRQRISLAKAELEQSLSKDFSQRTLVRFLKSLVADIKESADG